MIVVRISEDIPIHAGKLAKAIAQYMGGNGGGSQTRGEGGGGDPKLLDDALKFGEAVIKRCLEP